MSAVDGLSQGKIYNKRKELPAEDTYMPDKGLERICCCCCVVRLPKRGEPKAFLITVGLTKACCASRGHKGFTNLGLVLSHVTNVSW